MAPYEVISVKKHFLFIMTVGWLGRPKSAKIFFTRVRLWARKMRTSIEMCGTPESLGRPSLKTELILVGWVSCTVGSGPGLASTENLCQYTFRRVLKKINVLKLDAKNTILTIKF